MSHVNIYNQIIIYTITTILGIQPELCVIVKVSEEVIAGQIYTKVVRYHISQNKSVCTTVSKYIGKIKVEIKEILSSFTNTVIEYINKTTFWNLIQTRLP
jgi:hypothetical protein